MNGIKPRSVTLPEVELVELVEKNSTAAEIAAHFDVSITTVYNRLHKMNISLRGDRSASVTAWRDANQGIIKTRMLAEVPDSHFRRPYQRPESLKTTSPTDKYKNMEGRDENVLAPLSIFHFGGFYKLAKWGFVIHGCIDVYSRYLTYLDVSESNSPSTVLRLFHSGVTELGLPARVRCDDGAENVGVAHYMAVNRPQINDRIVFQSAGTNSRFKRMWMEVARHSLNKFLDLFNKMEKERFINPKSDIDMYCLHQCFMPLMKNLLKMWREDWNHNKTRSEMAPSALKIVGQLALRSRAATEKAYFPELDQSKITEVGEQEWPPSEEMSRTNAEVRIVKPLLEAADQTEMCSVLGLNYVTIETGQQVYELVRCYVRSILNPK